MCDNIVNNYVSEDRGIIVGIMMYLLMNYGQINNVVIKDERYGKIIGELFYNLPIKRKSKSKHINVVIRDNSINDGDIVISNINSLNETIHTKKIYFLLWGNKDNPLIMFKHKEKYSMNLKKMIHRHKIFYDDLIKNCGEYYFNQNIDSTILIFYLQKYNLDVLSVESLSKYIDCYINNYVNCTPQQYVLNNYIPVYLEGTREYIKEYVRLPSDNSIYKKKVSNFINNLTSKMNVISGIMN